MNMAQKGSKLFLEKFFFDVFGYMEPEMKFFMF